MQAKANYPKRWMNYDYGLIIIILLKNFLFVLTCLFGLFYLFLAILGDESNTDMRFIHLHGRIKPPSEA
jgi:hypothetical protein